MYSLIFKGKTSESLINVRNLHHPHHSMCNFQSLTFHTLQLQNVILIFYIKLFCMNVIFAFCFYPLCWTGSIILWYSPLQYFTPNLCVGLCFVALICSANHFFFLFGANFSGADLFLVWRRETPTQPQLLSGETRAAKSVLVTTQTPWLWRPEPYSCSLFPLAIFVWTCATSMSSWVRVARRDIIIVCK